MASGETRDESGKVGHSIVHTRDAFDDDVADTQELRRELVHRTWRARREVRVRYTRHAVLESRACGVAVPEHVVRHRDVSLLHAASGKILGLGLKRLHIETGIVSVCERYEESLASIARDL